MANNRKYVILKASEVLGVDFSKVLETSANTLRYNNDNTETFVKFEGNTPAFLNDKTTYTHAEIRVEMAKPAWTEEM